MTGVQYPASVLGDIDNDGDLDLVLTGATATSRIAKIYINNGSTLLENSTWQNNLTAVEWGALALGDIDNDGDLDLALYGCTNSAGDLGSGCESRIAKIYINNGSTLTENTTWQNNLTAAHDPSLTLGYINNDGYLDLVTTGNPIHAKVYLNNGTSFVENLTWQQDLTKVVEGQAGLGDVDNDGDLDLALTGDKGSATDFTSFYINNGTSFVESTQWNNNLVAMDRSSLIFGNYNNDKYLDLMICGHTTADFCYLYKNNGSDLLLNQSDNFPGLYRASIAFGDYENDGDLGWVGIGHENGRARVVENNESNDYNFIVDALAHANISNDLYRGTLTWGDVDNDNDLDLVIAATDFGLGVAIAKVFINNNTISNTKPLSPNSSFSSTYSNNVLKLGWGNGSDTETTNTSGLYYNLMIGNSTTNHTIVSGIFGGSSGGGGGAGGGANGYFGNMMQRKNITLYVKLVANTNYSWYVQTIDTGLAKSDWSARQTFVTTGDVDKPNVTLLDPSPNNSLHTTNPYFIFNVSVIDANMNNVSLYADFNATLIVNETNSSGINSNYTFTKNLTNLNDGLYQWYIYACDDDSNCQSSGSRNFYLDRAYPIVNSISPADSSTSTSASVTFEYNVSDTDIANCSLIIDNSVDQTDTSVTENTTESFTKSMSNGDYTWSINCTDYVGYTNSSASRSLTVSVTSSSPSGGGGGGSSSSTAPTINKTTSGILDIEKFDVDFSKISEKNIEMKQGDVKTFSFNNEITHKISLLEITTESVKIIIESEPITLVLKIGETKQIDINEDNINDIEITLNSISNEKANFVLKKLEGADIVGREELEEAVRKEALFDVRVSVLEKFKKVFPGEEVSAQIEVFNINNIGQVDVIVKYYITDKNDTEDKKVLAESSDTLAVEAVASFVRSLIIPEDIKPGTYYFNVDVTYKDFTTSSSTEFKVKSLKRRFIEEHFKDIVVIGITVIILVVIILFIYLRIIRKKEEKLERKEAKLEREIKRLNKRGLRKKSYKPKWKIWSKKK